MKLYLACLFTLLITVGFSLNPQISYADEASDSDTIIASSDSKSGTPTKRYAQDVTKEHAEENKSEDKRTDRNERQRLLAQRQSPEGNQFQRRLFMELPYEIRKELQNVPPEKRTDWMVDRIVERKAPMVEKMLCQNEKFQQAYEKASPDEKKQLLKRGLRSMANEKIDSPQPQRLMQQRMSPEQRQKLIKMSPENRADALSERLIQRNEQQIRRHIERNPELKKRLENLPPEKQKEAVKKAIKDRIHKRMKEDNKSPKRRGQFFDRQQRQMQFDRFSHRHRENLPPTPMRPNIPMRGMDGRGQERFGMQHNQMMMQGIMHNPEMIMRMIRNLPMAAKLKLFHMLKEDIDKNKDRAKKERDLKNKKNGRKKVERDKPNSKRHH